MSCLGMTGITLSIFEGYASEMEIQAHCDECNVISRSAVVAPGYCKQIITAAVWAEIDHKNGMRLGTRQRTIFGIFVLMVSTSKTKITMLLEGVHGALKIIQISVICFSKCKSLTSLKCFPQMSYVF